VLTEESYRLAWAIYLVGALGFLLLLRHWLHSHISAGWLVTLLLVLAALLLTPAPAASDSESYAPAWLVAVFDLLTHGAEALMRAAEPLLLMLLLAIALSLVFNVLSVVLFRKRPE
jgi:hypothetical protein